MAARSARRPLWRFALGAWLAAACVPVTVNITFPQEKLDSAASQIVDMSRRPPAPPPVPAPAPRSPGSSLPRGLAAVGPRAAEAQSRTIEVSQAPRTDTEEIRRLTASQAARLPVLTQWMSRGCIGENRGGLVEARPGTGCTDEVGRLVGDENRDRDAIVETFMRQNSIPAGDATRVRESFAKAYRERAPGGTWIQRADGQWARK